MTTVKEYTYPSQEDVKAEISREKYKLLRNSAFKSTMAFFMCVAAFVVLIAMLVMPVFRVYGTSMSPVLSDGEIVVTLKTSKITNGDIIAFYYNNKVLVKRVIATSGQMVNIDSEGTVTIDGVMLEEKYVDQKALGECNIELPYQVPEGKYFVMGDNRNISVDSRNSIVGCISQEQIVGKLIFRVWPLKNASFLKEK